MNIVLFHKLSSCNTSPVTQWVSCMLLSFAFSRPSTPIPPHRMFGSSMGEMIVWVCVQVDGKTPEGLLELDVSETIYVTAFKEKVQEEYEMFYGKKILGGTMMVS
jgi:hypothetical protein